MKRSEAIDAAIGPAFRNLIVVLALLALCTAAIVAFPGATNPGEPRCAIRI